MLHDVRSKFGLTDSLLESVSKVVNPVNESVEELDETKINGHHISNFHVGIGVRAYIPDSNPDKKKYNVFLHRIGGKATTKHSKGFDDLDSAKAYKAELVKKGAKSLGEDVELNEAVLDVNPKKVPDGEVTVDNDAVKMKSDKARPGAGEWVKVKTRLAGIKEALEESKKLKKKVTDSDSDDNSSAPGSEGYNQELGEAKQSKGDKEHIAFVKTMARQRIKDALKHGKKKSQAWWDGQSKASGKKLKEDVEQVDEDWHVIDKESNQIVSSHGSKQADARSKMRELDSANFDKTKKWGRYDVVANHGAGGKQASEVLNKKAPETSSSTAEAKPEATSKPKPSPWGSTPRSLVPGVSLKTTAGKTPAAKSTPKAKAPAKSKDMDIGQHVAAFAQRAVRKAFFESKEQIDEAGRGFSKKMTKLISAHQEEAKRKGATFHNLGAGVADDDIYSKTSHGGFSSHITSRGKIHHTWHDDEDLGEAVENIDEISKGLIARYKEKALKSRDKSWDKADASKTTREAGQHNADAEKRNLGIGRANNKLKKYSSRVPATENKE